MAGFIIKIMVADAKKIGEVRRADIPEADDYFPDEPETRTFTPPPDDPTRQLTRVKEYTAGNRELRPVDDDAVKYRVRIIRELLALTNVDYPPEGILKSPSDDPVLRLVAEIHTKLQQNGDPTYREIGRKALEALHEQARRELESLQREIELQVRSMLQSELFQSLQVRASIDGLTGLWNRDTFFEYAPKIFEYVRSRGGKMAFVVVDLDYFHFVNEDYGHEGGDEVLKCIGEIIRRQIRKYDIAGRIGQGEEFGILLRETDLDGAYKFTERLRRIIERTIVEYGDLSIDFTASFGVAAADFEKDDDFSALYNRSDGALYQAKNVHGRNSAVKSFYIQDGLGISCESPKQRRRPRQRTRTCN